MKSRLQRLPTKHLIQVYNITYKIFLTTSLLTMWWIYDYVNQTVQLYFWIILFLIFTYDFRFTCNTLNTKKNFEKSRHHNIDSNFSDRIQDSENNKTEQNNNSENYIENKEILQFQKEKECWSSFHKMTNKGLFVSFDTILRYAKLHIFECEGLLYYDPIFSTNYTYFIFILPEVYWHQPNTDYANMNYWINNEGEKLLR